MDVREDQAASAAEATPLHGRLVLSLLCAGQFMVILDASIVNVALPSIRTGLGFDGTGLQWVVNAYALAFAGFLLVGGRAADLFGHRRMITAGFSLFTAASLAGGLASGPGVLIADRAAQGIGAAVLSPATLTILTATFTGSASRAKALGAWSSMAAAGGVAGNILGGVLTGTLGWRWILLINVPIGAGLIAVAALVLTGERGSSARGLDLSGAVAGTTVLVAFAYGMVQIPAHGWAAPRTLIPLLGGMGALVLFVLIETRLAAKPMMPLGLLRGRSVSVGLALMVLVGATSLPMWYFVSLYLQNVLHFGPLRAGLAMAPYAVTIALFARLTGRLLPRTGARSPIVAGSVLAVVGYAWLAGASAASTYLADVLGPGLLISAGTGLVFTPITAVVTARVARNEAGILSGVVNAARQGGAALGLAALTTIASTQVRSALGMHPGAEAAGFDRAFLAAAAISLGGAILALVGLPGRQARSRIRV